jgi:transcriptional regulator with AAA-type ATPase domain
LPQPFEGCEPGAEAVSVADLDPEQRRRIAVQMVAVSSLLGDAELWPGRRALASASVVATGDGFVLRLPALPVSLPAVWSRLGGGEEAARATRGAVIEAVVEVTGVEPAAGGRRGLEPGFFLDGALAQLLERLEAPLDIATARSLWMWRWSAPPLPDPGDARLVDVADLGLARRLGASLWAAAARAGRGATLEMTTDGAEAVTVAAAEGSDRVRVAAGSFDAESAASLVDRSGTGTVATVGLGAFPGGWNARPFRLFNPGRLAAHLGIVGVRPVRRQRIIDELKGRFDPLSSADRGRLTESARRLFEAQKTRPTQRFTRLVRVASLAPEGIPEDLGRELAGASDKELAAAVEGQSVLVRDGRLMLPEAASMKVDPLHSEVAAVFPTDSPQGMLHRGLAVGNAGEVLTWARSRLDDLDAAAVRDLLQEVEAGALGSGVQAAHAEACLSLADAAGARRALKGMDREIAGPWRDWLRLLDRTPQGEVPLPQPIDVRHAPRACAEIALVALRRSVGRSAEAAGRSVVVITEAMERLHGPSRRWIDIRFAARMKPERLNDRQWRKEVADGHPELEGLLLFERASRAILDRQYLLARRLLRRLIDREGAPGRMASMQVNLGLVEGELGRPAVSERLTLGAYRLFQVAGFRHREWVALHNLAVADIDQLRLRRAARRLDRLGALETSIFEEVERVRLALAAGHLEDFRRRLGELPAVEDGADEQIAQAIFLLRGVEALFDGCTADATSLLARGGEEGKAWLELVGEIPSGMSGEDGWGVRRAAALAVELRHSRAVAWDERPLDLKDGMAVALCRELAVRPGWPPSRLRQRAARVLSDCGIDGWASRMRWGPEEADGFHRALSEVIRGQRLGTLQKQVPGGLLEALGVTGLVVREAARGRDLLAIGEGRPVGGMSRGGFEVIPLGFEPLPGPAWDLFLDVLSLLAPTQGVEISEPSEEVVRIDGGSPAAERLRSEILRVAGPSFNLLIHGETGSGKEIVAREIHRLSGRTGDLVCVNVAAIPGNLLESELFGAVKGAFTGADRHRRGLVAAADGGTLFLDEVGDLDATLQVKLLRFMEAGEVRAVGSDQVREVDTRVVCATHRNLKRRVRQARFREDLYYRMAVATIEVPPLRERRLDIPVLRSIFEREAARRYGLPVPTWSRRAEEMLMSHSWPGNVRELKHTVEVAMARSGGRQIRPADLPIPEADRPVRGSWESALADFKRTLLTEVLARHHGNRSAAARELGISRQGLLYQIRKLGLKDL